MHKTRKAIFLDQKDRVVPWARLVDLIAPQYSEGRTGRPPFALKTTLRTHFLQHWFNLSDPAMEETFFDTPLYRRPSGAGAAAGEFEFYLETWRHSCTDPSEVKQLFGNALKFLCELPINLPTGFGQGSLAS